MSFDRFAGRFDRAVLVRDGRATESDLVTRQGASVLRDRPRHEALAALAPVRLSGVARPGQVMTILPGRYAGRPEPAISWRLLRSGVADLALAAPSFAILPEDLGRELRVIETARNASGAIETEASVVVARLAPTVVTASRVAADVATDADLPVTLASLEADGDGPFEWTMTGAPAGLFLIGDGTGMVLSMSAIPPVGDYPLTLRAANVSGGAATTFALRVAVPAIAAPRRVGLSPETMSLAADAALPRDLATLEADGTAPVDWAVSGAGAAAEIDVTGAAPVLRLLAPLPQGRHLLTVTAANGAGMASAGFLLEMEAAAPVVTAPTAVTLTASALTLAEDAALPATLALVSADGTPPVTWSHDGGEGFGLEPAGAGMALVLRAMPAAGAGTVAVTARNAAGSATASFALTVEAAAPATTAPAAVTLSSGAATVRADAALPLTLAELAADGTQPVTWSLEGAPAWAGIETIAQRPVLRLLAMPPVGARTLTVRAANAAGAAQGAFALTIEAVPRTDAPAPAITTSAGTITAQRVNADGSMTFTLDEGGVASEHTIPAATVRAGHAAMLMPPAVGPDGTGGHAVTRPALVVAPTDDPASITQEWLVGGSPTGVTGDVYALREPAEALLAIELVTRLTNLAMEQAGTPVVTRVSAQAAQVAIYAPMTLRRADNDRVVFAAPAQAVATTNMVAFLRLRPQPAANETDMRGRALRLGALQVDFGSQTELRLAPKLGQYDAAGTLSTFSVPTPPVIRPGLTTDLVVLYGAVQAATDNRPSVKYRIWQDGVPVSFLFNGNLVEEVSLLANANPVRFASGQKFEMGGLDDYTAGTGGLSHLVERACVFTGIGAGILPGTALAARASFVGPDGTLAHPDVAVRRFGQGLLDLRNTTGSPVNHGSLGAPLSMSNLA